VLGVVRDAVDERRLEQQLAREEALQLAHPAEALPRRRHEHRLLQRTAAGANHCERGRRVGGRTAMLPSRADLQRRWGRRP
jgi:hypothetical protein